MKNAVFTGAAVALVTPMNPDGSVNFETLAQLLEDQIAKGTDAILICGTTGESATLSDEEKLSCIDFAVRTIRHRVPVVAGTGSNNTAHSIQLSKRAAELGADALLVVTPYYNKTSQAGLAAHFNAIANAAKLPVILYNVPSRTGVNLAPETVFQLSKNPYIVGIKEASGNISQCAKIAELCGDEIALYSGNDDQVVPVLALGGKGVISVVSNVAPAQMHACCQVWFDGDVKKARELQLKLLPLCRAMFCDVNPIPVKYGMQLQGWQVGNCRLPLVGPAPEQQQQIRTTLQQYNLVDSV